MESWSKISFFLVFFILIVFSGCTQLSPSFSKTTQTGIKELPHIPISAPMTISEPGYYQLTQDVVPTSINKSKSGSCLCFYIKSSDVVFDGMGHVIDGSKIDPPCPEWSDGFYFDDKPGTQSIYPNITIRNVTVSNWQGGIELNGGHNVHLENVTVTGSKNGVSIHSSSNITLSHNKITKNTWIGIWGRDNENITFDSNIIADNPSQGIYLDRQQETPPEFTLFKQRIRLFPYTYYKKTTSGIGIVISNNSVSGSSDGINLRNFASPVIENNYFLNNSRSDITLYNIENPVIRNNTYANNREKITSNGSAINQGFFSFTIGTVLLYLIHVLIPTINAGLKITVSRIMKRLSKNYSFIGEKISIVVEKTHASKILMNSTAVSVAGAGVFGGAFTLISSFGQKIEVFALLTLIGGVVVIVPRVIQYITANKLGVQAVYRLWWEGILVIFLTTWLTLVLGGNIFGQPVRTVYGQEYEDEKKKFALIMLAGPLVSLILSASFLSLYLMKGTYADIAWTGLNMSLLSAVVSFLPISPMEGERVFRWNKIVWAGVFFPILVVYGYFFMLP
jgi:parallel beta-helix repeat protein